MPDLKKRASGKEIMDDFSLPATEVVPVLKGLDQMNMLFGGNKTIISALKKLRIKNGCHISDWGCGGGGTLRAIAKWAAAQHYQVKLTGVDASPSTIGFAQAEAGKFDNIGFILTDVLNHEWKSDQFDIVFSSLFTHHFTDDELVTLLKKMLVSSKKAVIITDLHRHWLLYYAVVVIAYVFTKNKMARYDGPLSVKRGFKKAELISLLNKSGVVNYHIKWRWAFNWEVVIYKG